MSTPTTLRSVLLTPSYIPVPCHPTIQDDPSEVHEHGQCHLELGQCLQAYKRVCHSTQPKNLSGSTTCVHHPVYDCTLAPHVLTLVTASGLNTNTALFGYLIRRSPDSSTVFTMPTLSRSWRKNKRHHVVYCNTIYLAIMEAAFLTQSEYA